MVTSLGLLRNLWQFNNLHACLHNSWNVGENWLVVVEIFGDIGQFRPSRSTIFIFYHTLTQKLLNRFSPFFTRCRAISGAVNACIHMTIEHPVLKWKGTEWRSFRKFYPKLVAMATSLDKFENTVLIHHRHVKRFHERAIKRLQISVQYMRRYSTKYAEPRRQQATQFLLRNYWTDLHQNFTRYSGISGAT